MKLYSPKSVDADSKVQDETTRAMLFEGASISQLAKLFGLDNRTVSGKLQFVRPCGKRAGHPIYLVKDAAPYLVKPTGDIEAYIRKMNPAELPPMLQKEYWAGQHARLKFEEDRGDLWRTEAVVEKFADVFKVLRTSLNLLQDRVEREIELNDKQRAIIRAHTDSALRDLNKSLVEKYANEPVRTFEHTGAGESDFDEAATASGTESERTADEDDPAADL